jgi:hypothetical protein
MKRNQKEAHIYHNELLDLLIRAGTDGDLGKVQQLISLCGPLDKFFKPKTYRRTAIVKLFAEVVRHGHVQIVKYIISLNNYFAQRSFFDMLNIAAVFNRGPVAQLIVQQIRRRNLAYKVKFTVVAFTLALDNESVDVLKVIYDKVGGFNALFYMYRLFGPRNAWMRLKTSYAKKCKSASVKFLESLAY